MSMASGDVIQFGQGFGEPDAPADSDPGTAVVADGEMQRAAEEAAMRILNPTAPDEDVEKVVEGLGDGEGQDLAERVRAVLSTKAADDNLARLEQQWQDAQSIGAAGDPRLEPLKVELEGARFDAEMARQLPLTRLPAEVLEAKVFEARLAFENADEAFSDAVTMRGASSATAIKASREREAAEAALASLDQIRKLAAAITIANQRADAEAREAVAKAVKEADRQAIATLETEKAEVWQIEQAKALSKIPVEKREGYKTAFDGEVRAARARQYLAHREAHVQSVFDAEKYIVPPITLKI